MAAKKQPNTQQVVIADMGSPNSEPQWKFFLSRVKYTCYGGAKGGGKSWAIVRKAALGAYNYPGIQIIMVRREYEQMENPIIQPMLKILAPGTYQYNKTDHLLTFTNGSKIKFGNMPDYEAATEGKYQGQSWDWLFIDEATQFTEQEFRGLVSIVRGDSSIPKRIYLTCNPGGVGHFWVKRLFVDRQFKPKENPDEYVFIPATVDDNKDINQDYKDQLAFCSSLSLRANRTSWTYCRRISAAPTAMVIGTLCPVCSLRSLRMVCTPASPSRSRLTGRDTGRLTMVWICSSASGWQWTKPDGVMSTGNLPRTIWLYLRQRQSSWN